MDTDTGSNWPVVQFRQPVTEISSLVVVILLELIKKTVRVILTQVWTPVHHSMELCHVFTESKREGTSDKRLRGWQRNPKSDGNRENRTSAWNKTSRKRPWQATAAPWDEELNLGGIYHTLEFSQTISHFTSTVKRLQTIVKAKTTCCESAGPVLPNNFDTKSFEVEFL